MENEIIFPLLEYSLEFEMSWNNIIENDIKTEMVAIINEDYQILNESNIFERILHWIKERIEAFKLAIKKIRTKLMVSVNNAMLKIKKIDTSKLSSITVKVSEMYYYQNFSYNNISRSFEKACRLIFEINKKYYDTFRNGIHTSKTKSNLINTYDDSYKQIYDALKESIYKNGNPMIVNNVTVRCADALRNISNSKEGLNQIIKNSERQNLTHLQDGYRLFSKLKDKFVTHNKNVTTNIFKQGSSTINNMSNFCIVAGIRILTDSVKVIKIGIKEMNKKADSNDKK